MVVEPQPSGSLVMVGKTPPNRCQQDALSLPIMAYNLRRTFDHTIDTQQQLLSGPNTLKLQRRSDHTDKSQQYTLPGSLAMVVKKSKIQVDLPLHLIVYEILSRLPVKTLSRFRCVSKPLRSFISDAQFQKVHSRRSQQNPLTLVATSDTTHIHFSTYTIHGEKLLKDFSISFGRPSQVIPFTSFDLVHSCLGLVCLRTFYKGAILILNPSTAEVITLPECPDQRYDLRVGFAYVDFSDEFKVVRFFTRHLFGDYSLAEDIDGGDDVHNEICISEVFTLGSSEGWRETRSPPPFKPCPSGHLPLVHGALHFLPSVYYHPGKRDGHYISAFDVCTEQYRGIPLPEIYFGFENQRDNQCDLAELRGSLCMSFDFFKSNKLLQLWFLKDYHGGKWVKEYNIELAYKPELFGAFAFTGDSHVLLNVCSSKEERRLSYYNAQEKCIASTLGINCSAILFTDTFLPLPLRNRMTSSILAP